MVNRCVRTKVCKESNSYPRCMDCKWLDLDNKIIIGCLCTNTVKKFKNDTSQWKYPSTKACKLFEERSTIQCRNNF